MLTFDVAYLSVGGTELILVPVADSFADWPRDEQLAAAAEFERQAARGGMNGVVVPVWKSAAGRAVFLVRPGLRAAVETLTWESVTRRVNYRVTIARQPALTRQPVP